MFSKTDDGEPASSQANANPIRHMNGSVNNLESSVPTTTELVNSNDQMSSNLEPSKEEPESFEDSTPLIKSNDQNRQVPMSLDLKCCPSSSVTPASSDVPVQTFIQPHAHVPVPVNPHIHPPFGSNLAPSTFSPVPVYDPVASAQVVPPSTLMTSCVSVPPYRPLTQQIYLQSLQQPRAPALALPSINLQTNDVLSGLPSTIVGVSAGVMATGGSFNSVVRAQLSQQCNSNNSTGTGGENVRSGSNGSGDYFVMVHVDAGETFSVRVDDKIEHIPGPATVRMVCNSGPPFPMTMQVPPGHLVQQIVDEDGILTHVILSLYPGPMHPSTPRGVVHSGASPSMPDAESVNGLFSAPGTGANLIIDPTRHIQATQQAGGVPHEHISTTSPVMASRSGPLTVPLTPYAHAAHHHLHPHHHPHPGLQHATTAHGYYHHVPFMPHHPAVAHFRQQFQHISPLQPVPQQHVFHGVTPMHAKHILASNNTVPLTIPLNSDGCISPMNFPNSTTLSGCHTSGVLTNGSSESSPPLVSYSEGVQNHNVQQATSSVVQQKSDIPEGCTAGLPSSYKLDEVPSNANDASSAQRDDGDALKYPPKPPPPFACKDKATDGATLEGASALYDTQATGEPDSLLPPPHSDTVVGPAETNSTSSLISGSKRKRAGGSGKNTGFRSPRHPRPTNSRLNRQAYTTTTTTTPTSVTSTPPNNYMSNNGRRPERTSCTEPELCTSKLTTTNASPFRPNSIPPRLKSRRSQQSTPTTMNSNTITHPSTSLSLNNPPCPPPTQLHHSHYNQGTKSVPAHHPTGTVCKNSESDHSIVPAVDTAAAAAQLEDTGEDKLLMLERAAIVSILSNIQPPQVSEVELHSAVIQLTLPSCLSAQLPHLNHFDNRTGAKVVDVSARDNTVVARSDSTYTESMIPSTEDAQSADYMWIHLDQNDIQFELHLADRDAGSRFKCIFEGEATHISLKELSPGTDYYVKTCCVYADLSGNHSSIIHFTTLSSEPNPPKNVAVIGPTRNSLNVKWCAARDNGSRITSYRLEYAVQLTPGAGGVPTFVEAFNGLARSCKITQLASNTTYLIRVMSINAKGQSRWSSVITASTSGSPPVVPRTPFLVAADVHSLTLAWHHHPDSPNFLPQSPLSASTCTLANVNYMLEMDDEAMEHGFVTVFDGTGVEHCVENLRRNTRYRFRLSASNVDGRSRCSDVVCYSTLPDRPTPPLNLRLSSAARSSQLTFTWDVPEDDGGLSVQAYRLEMRLPFIAKADFDTDARSFYSPICDSIHLDQQQQHSDDFHFLCWPHVTGIPSQTTFASVPPLLTGMNSAPVRPRLMCTSQLTGLPTSFRPHSIWHALCQLPINDDDHGHDSDQGLNGNDNELCEPYHRQQQASPLFSDEQQYNPDNDSTSHDGWCTASLAGAVRSAWFIIYEGLGRDIGLDNLTPGLHSILRVRARSITLLDLANSGTLSSSSNSTQNPTRLFRPAESNSALIGEQDDESILASVGLWGQATSPPLRISLPPVFPGAPPFPPKLLGCAKSNSLRLVWPKPRNTGGTSIISYELCQVNLDPVQTSCGLPDCESTSSAPRSCSVGTECYLKDGGRLHLMERQNTFPSQLLNNSDPTYGMCKSLTTLSYVKHHRDEDDDPLSDPFAEYSDKRWTNCCLFTVSGRECTVDGLHPGQLYAFRVRARNRVGRGPWSGSAVIRTCASVPDAPTHAPCVQYVQSDNKLVVSWNPVLRVNGANIKEYVLEWQLDSPWNQITLASCDTSQSPKKKSNHSPSKIVLAHSTPNRLATEKAKQSKESESICAFQLLYVGPALSHKLASPQPDCLMQFRVCAVNSAGSSPWSPLATFRTAAAPPGQPYGVSLKQIHCNTARVSWLIPPANGSPITSFTLELTSMNAGADTTEPSMKRIMELSAPAPCWPNGDAKMTGSNTMIEYRIPKTMEHLVSGLLPYTHYKIRIQASNVFGQSSFSGGLTFLTLPPHPNPPVFEKPTSITSSSVRLHWSLPTSVPPSPARVTQVQPFGSLSPSSGQYTEQRNPTDAVRSNETLDRAKELAIQYTLEMYHPADSVWSIVYESPETSYKVNRLTENTTFEFRLTASNCSGVSCHSGIQKIHTLRLPPQAVRGLKVVELGSDSCQIEWCAQTGPSIQPNSTNSVDPIVYVLHLMPVPVNITGTSAMSTQNQIYRGTQASCRITDLVPNTEYVCRVFAVRLCQPDTLPVTYHGSDNHTDSYSGANGSEAHSLDNIAAYGTDCWVDNRGFISSSVWRRKILSDTSDQVHELAGPSSPSLVFTTRSIREVPRSTGSFSQSGTTSAAHQATSASHTRCISKYFAPWPWLTSWFSSRRPEFLFRGSFARLLSSSEVTTSGDSVNVHRSNQSSPVLSNNVTSSPWRRRTALSSNSTVSAIHMQQSAQQQHPQPSSSALIARSGSNYVSTKQRPFHWFRLSERKISYLLLTLFIMTTLLVCVGVQIFLTVHVNNNVNSVQ